MMIMMIMMIMMVIMIMQGKYIYKTTDTFDNFGDDYNAIYKNL